MEKKIVFHEIYSYQMPHQNEINFNSLLKSYHSTVSTHWIKSLTFFACRCPAVPDPKIIRHGPPENETSTHQMTKQLCQEAISMRTKATRLENGIGWCNREQIFKKLATQRWCFSFESTLVRNLAHRYNIASLRESPRLTFVLLLLSLQINPTNRIHQIGDASLWHSHIESQPRRLFSIK